MTLQASGSPISASQILREIKVTSLVSGAWLSNEAKLRELANIPSGTIKYSDFYSKSVFDNFALQGGVSMFSPSYTFICFELAPYPQASQDLVQEVFDGTTDRSGGFLYITPTKTNLQTITGRQVKVQIIAAPSGGGGAPTLTLYNYDDVTLVKTAYTGGTWTDLAANKRIRAEFDFGGAGVACEATIQIGVRWGTDAATEITRNFTITRVH